MLKPVCTMNDNFPVGSVVDQALGSLTLAAQGQAATGHSLLGYIHAGGVISYILVLISICALGLVISNMLMLRRSALMPDRVILDLDKLCRSKDVAGIEQYCKMPENDSFLSRIFGPAVGKVGRSALGMIELKPAIEDAGARELDKLDRLNHLIAMIAAIGPMLGLLGTVIGMVKAFASLGGASGAMRNEQLSDAMSIALVTTAEGLIVAIPCTVAYAIFKRRADQLASEVGDVAEKLGNLLVAGGKQNAPLQARQTPAGAMNGAGVQAGVQAGS
jgi:biopolymer transport protein ExbB